MAKTTTTEIAKMTDTLRFYGAWATGSQDPSDVADSWAAEGICTDDELEQWLDAGVFAPEAAGELRKAGVKPDDLEGRLEGRGERVGYAFANGDVSLERVLAHIGRA